MFSVPRFMPVGVALDAAAAGGFEIKPTESSADANLYLITAGEPPVILYVGKQASDIRSTTEDGWLTLPPNIHPVTDPGPDDDPFVVSAPFAC